MPTTCIIRYEIEPTKVHRFEDYARTWGQCIASCGAGLVGYFAPHEGSVTTAYGVYHIESLAAYEAYRERLKAHALGQSNYAFAQREKFLLKQDRIFLRLVSRPQVSFVTA